MKAVHFGAGNIGRGFIGLLLHRAGYEVVFADVVPSLVDELNRQMSYRVITLEADVQVETVDGVRAVPLDSEACKREIASAGLVTTAVGLGNLQGVAGVIADGLQMRQAENCQDILHVMACENAIRASTTLKGEVLAKCDTALRAWIETHVGFVDVAVDRIAPNRAGYASEPLDAVVERFFEWDIESTGLKSELTIPGATFVKQLDPFLARKLFVLNGAHATAAYAGYHKKYATVLEAMDDTEIATLVEAVQNEAICGLLREYPDLVEEELKQYAKDVRDRFRNPHIHDEVHRVGRDPLRKLSASDRLMGPLRLARQVTQQTPALTRAVALGLLYDNPNDDAAVRMQSDIRTVGIETAVVHVTGCTDARVVADIVGEYHVLQENDT